MKLDEVAKSPNVALVVIPAKAGIQYYQAVLDSGLRRSDVVWDFLRVHQNMNL